MSDLLDEIDDHDQPTGRQLRRDDVCRGKTLIPHRCVAVYAFAPEGHLYVQTHKESGLYDHSVGGHVDAGEDYATAALREADEELGIRGVAFHELGTGVFSPEANRVHVFGIYECFPGPEWSFTPNEEVDEITPMTLDEIVTLINEHPEQCTGGFINVFKYYIERKELPYKITV